MSAKTRRKELLEVLKKQNNVISASKLAEMFSVSRQIIVGDVALLRAQDNKIVATSRGYILESNLTDSGYTGKLVVFHPPERTREELYTIVDLGGKILDAEIEHEIYGDISGKLNISSRAEVDEFIEQIEKTSAKLLTELTDGMHIHTVTTADKETFDKIKAELKQKGILYISD